MIYHLTSADYISEKTGCSCSYFRSNINVCYLHNHEFYELVITMNDNVIHEVGNVRRRLKKDSLMLIRPHDIHRYVDEGQGEFSYVNLAFSQETFNEVAKCLCAEEHMKLLAEAKEPSVIVLSESQASSITNQFLNLMGDGAVPEPLIYSRGVITSVISKYFLNGFVDNPDNEIPQWLVLLCSEMHKIENFSGGIEKLCELSGMSYGYIGHSFKKYFGISPTEYINEIRLEYAGNMLTNTNMSIIDVSLECGFENLGYFYKIFKRKYGTTPSKYKKTMTKKLII